MNIAYVHAQAYRDTLQAYRAVSYKRRVEEEEGEMKGVYKRGKRILLITCLCAYMHVCVCVYVCM